MGFKLAEPWRPAGLGEGVTPCGALGTDWRGLSQEDLHEVAGCTAAAAGKVVGSSGRNSAPGLDEGIPSRMTWLERRTLFERSSSSSSGGNSILGSMDGGGSSCGSDARRTAQLSPASETSLESTFSAHSAPTVSGSIHGDSVVTLNDRRLPLDSCEEVVRYRGATARGRAARRKDTTSASSMNTLALMKLMLLILLTSAGKKLKMLQWAGLTVAPLLRRIVELLVWLTWRVARGGLHRLHSQKTSPPRTVVRN